MPGFFSFLLPPSDSVLRRVALDAQSVLIPFSEIVEIDLIRHDRGEASLKSGPAKPDGLR